MDLEELIALIQINSTKTNIIVINHLLHRNFSAIDGQENSDNQRLMKNVIRVNNFEIFDFLVDHGYDLLRTEGNKGTLACRVLMYGNDQFLEKIISKLPDVPIYKIFGYTAVGKLAIEKGNLDIIQLLVKYKYQFSKNHLFYAIKYGQIEIFKYFVENCLVSIDTKNDNGCFMLHYSIDEKQFEITDYLLEQGAEIDFYTSKDKDLINILKSTMTNNVNTRSSSRTSDIWIDEMKLLFKIFAKIVFAKFCNDKLMKIPVDYDREARIHIKQIISDQKIHVEVDRELVKLFVAKPYQIIKQIIKKCEIKFYQDIEVNDKPVVLEQVSKPIKQIYSLKLLAALALPADLRDDLSKSDNISVPKELKPLIIAAGIVKPFLQENPMEIQLNGLI